MIMPNKIGRREFNKLFGFSSLAFLTVKVASAARKIWLNVMPDYAASVPVASVHEVAVGGYKLFRYPTENDPCILLRLGQDQFVAYNQNCTHLSCPVHFNSDTTQLECPCHLGCFSAEDGRPLAGPPQRALPALSLSIRKGQVWASMG